MINIDSLASRSSSPIEEEAQYAESLATQYAESLASGDTECLSVDTLSSINSDDDGTQFKWYIFEHQVRVANLDMYRSDAFGLIEEAIGHCYPRFLAKLEQKGHIFQVRFKRALFCQLWQHMHLHHTNKGAPFSKEQFKHHCWVAIGHVTGHDGLKSMIEEVEGGSQLLRIGIRILKQFPIECHGVNVIYECIKSMYVDEDWRVPNPPRLATFSVRDLDSPYEQGLCRVFNLLYIGRVIPENYILRSEKLEAQQSIKYFKEFIIKAEDVNSNLIYLFDLPQGYAIAQELCYYLRDVNLCESVIFELMLILSAANQLSIDDFCLFIDNYSIDIKPHIPHMFHPSFQREGTFVLEQVIRKKWKDDHDCMHCLSMARYGNYDSIDISGDLSSISYFDQNLRLFLDAMEKALNLCHIREKNQAIKADIASNLQAFKSIHYSAWERIFRIVGFERLYVNLEDHDANLVPLMDILEKTKSHTADITSFDVKVLVFVVCRLLSVAYLIDSLDSIPCCCIGLATKGKDLNRIPAVTDIAMGLQVISMHDLPLVVIDQSEYALFLHNEAVCQEVATRYDIPIVHMSEPDVVALLTKLDTRFCDWVEVSPSGEFDYAGSRNAASLCSTLIKGCMCESIDWQSATESELNFVYKKYTMGNCLFYSADDDFRFEPFNFLMQIITVKQCKMDSRQSFVVAQQYLIGRDTKSNGLDPVSLGYSPWTSVPTQSGMFCGGLFSRAPLATPVMGGAEENGVNVEFGSLSYSLFVPSAHLGGVRVGASGEFFCRGKKEDTSYKYARISRQNLLPSGYFSQMPPILLRDWQFEFSCVKTTEVAPTLCEEAQNEVSFVHSLDSHILTCFGKYIEYADQKITPLFPIAGRKFTRYILRIKAELELRSLEEQKDYIIDFPKKHIPRGKMLKPDMIYATLQQCLIHNLFLFYVGGIKEYYKALLAPLKV